VTFEAVAVTSVKCDSLPRDCFFVILGVLFYTNITQHVSHACDESWVIMWPVLWAR